MSSGTVTYASQADRGSHEPDATASDRFHETWYLAWYDPERRAVGFHHVGQYRSTGVADVWSWLALDGRLITQYENLELPLATGEVTNFELAGISVETVDDRTQACTVRHEDVISEVTYDAFTDPFSFSMDTGGIGYGAGHLESIGRITGRLSVGDSNTDVNGWGYHDHSWGERDYGAVLAQRWVYAVFGPDLFFSAMSFVLPNNDIMHRGYVFDRGEFHAVKRADYGIRVATDGHSPEACDVRIFTSDGLGYRATGAVEVSGTSRHHGGYFQTDGFGPFEYGGRIGTGQTHIRERATAPAADATLGHDE